MGNKEYKLDIFHFQVLGVLVIDLLQKVLSFIAFKVMM